MRWRRGLWIWLPMFFAAVFSMGGCEMECDCDDGGSIEKNIDEVGDEIEDVTDELDNDGR